MLSEAGEHAPGAQRPSSGLFSAWLCCAAWEDTMCPWFWSMQSGAPPSLGFQILDLSLLVHPCSASASAVRRGLLPSESSSPSLGWAPVLTFTHTHTHACVPSAWNAFPPHTWGGGLLKGRRCVS